MAVQLYARMLAPRTEAARMVELVYKVASMFWHPVLEAQVLILEVKAYGRAVACLSFKWRFYCKRLLVAGDTSCKGWQGSKRPAVAV